MDAADQPGYALFAPLALLACRLRRRRVSATPKRRRSPRCRSQPCRRCRPIRPTNLPTIRPRQPSARRCSSTSAEPRRRRLLRTCHLIDRQFQDDLPRGKGVGTTNRRTMPLAGVAWSPWFFWDGRRDSLWAQALTPLEDPVGACRQRAPPTRISSPRISTSATSASSGRCPICRPCRSNAGPLGTDAEKAAWAAMSPSSSATA